MRLGLLSDIHEHVPLLKAALKRLDQEGVDQIVVLGDVFELGEHLDATCELLIEAHAIGVWGNHDFGLCVGVTAQSHQRYAPATLAFMGALRPRLTDWGCYFSHVEPWLNPERLEDLWYFEGTPRQHGNLDRIFAAVPERILFAGHYHEWIVTRPDRVEPWCGERAIDLSDGRYFVVLGAVCHGDFAIFDTETSELVPLHVE